jgi:hypothetical protein
MEHYVGLDVSLKRTSICVVNHTGSVVREGVVDSEPEGWRAGHCWSRSSACQAQRSAQGQSRGRPQARSPSASYVDRRDRVQLVDEEACGVACTGEITGFPRHSGKRRPCRDDGGGEIARCLACTRKGDRAFNIDPPTSSYAIMRRARPYRGENSGPGKERFGELDTKPRN